jgi:hypothetical protein
MKITTELLSTLTLHIGASGPILAWRVVTCDELETLAVQTRVFVGTVTLKLAQAIDARSAMLAWVGSTFVNINITSGQKEHNKLLIYCKTWSTASRLPLGPTQPPTQCVLAVKRLRWTTHLHLVLRSRMVELYFHSFICLYRIVLTYVQGRLYHYYKNVLFA